MNKELIEKLKNNEEHRIFADMTSDEKKCLKWVSPENCEFLTDNNCENLEWGSQGTESKWYPQGIYRIKPDYQPEPEYEDKEIIKGISHISRCPLELLGYYYEDDIFIPLHCLPDLPNFAYFFYVENETEQIIEFDCVARWIAEKKQTVFARFRK